MLLSPADPALGLRRAPRDGGRAEQPQVHAGADDAGRGPEPGHRSPLPVWIKFPVIAGVIVVLVLSKQLLLGFMTMFPMVGVVTAYEARHSLWTICRQMPVLMMASAPMMAVCRLTEDRIGLGGGLALGWCVFLAILIPITLRNRFPAQQER